MARHMLSHKLATASPLPYSYLETVLLEVGAMMNLQPLAVRYAADNDILSVCPADILLGRAHRQKPELSALALLPEDLGVLRAMDHQQHLVTEWSKQVMAQALPRWCHGRPGSRNAGQSMWVT